VGTITNHNISLQSNVESPMLHPQKFGLWIGIASMIMMFVGFTSAYLVRKDAGNWVEFQIPVEFYISAIAIALSSLTIWMAVRAYKKQKIGIYRLGLGLTLLLGLAFCYTQFMGWNALTSIGIYLDGNPSGSFVRVLSYVHFAHVGLGLLLLTAMLIKAVFLLSNSANFLIDINHPNKGIQIELMATYWHFVGLLWLYLLLFFRFV